MARDLEHFELQEWKQTLPRRRHGGGGLPRREDQNAHGRGLILQADRVADHLQERNRAAPQGINPKLIFKLQLHPQGNLEEEQLRQLDLRLLARDPHRAIVVFPDEATLHELRRHLSEYAGLVPKGHSYSYLASIEAITELTPSDRTGTRLREGPLTSDEMASLDIELWHGGDNTECRERISEIQSFLRRQNLDVTDWWIGERLCLLRAKVNFSVLETLLNIDYVKEIDRRPAPTFEMRAVSSLNLSQIEVDESLPEGLVGVLVVDSGVMQRHPLLGHAIGDAQVFPDRLRSRIRGGAEDGDEKTGGHGTAVAGIAVYNDVGDCISSRTFRASARLFSARITDDKNEYDEDELVEHQLEEAIEYFLNNYPSIKVINISLGDEKLVYSDGSYQFRFAATIDELAYRYRDREVVFVVSAGNFWPGHLNDEEIVEQYPTYLLLSSNARVIDPATSAIAVTVGGLSYGEGEDLRSPNINKSGTECLVAGERYWPSPFTRIGWGIDGAVKPEVVDFAGDMRFERGSIPKNPVYAGLPTTARDFAPPEGRLFRTVSGTSFAAPRVANIAARLFSEFPSASSNLIRALIADSARIPSSRPGYFHDKTPWDKDVLRVYGYGQPDFIRARWSSQNEVLLLSDDSIELDSFQLFTIPPLPEEFVETKGGHISVTLAFDPPTRHTRSDSYLGVAMEFAVYRNVTPEDVADAIREWKREEREGLENQDLPSLSNLRRTGDPPVKLQMKPGVNQLKKGTLQRALLRINGTNWKYNGDSLVLAVICQRKWAPSEITHQRFAVVTSLYHDNPSIDIYSHIQQYVRVHQRVRVQV